MLHLEHNTIAGLRRINRRPANRNDGHKSSVSNCCGQEGCWSSCCQCDMMVACEKFINFYNTDKSQGLSMETRKMVDKLLPVNWWFELNGPTTTTRELDQLNGAKAETNDPKISIEQNGVRERELEPGTRGNNNLSLREGKLDQSLLSPLSSLSPKLLIGPSSSSNNKLQWALISISAVILYTILILLLLPTQRGGLLVVDAIAPTIDYSHNMRILKLPKSTQIGSLIYRLRGSDGDPNSQLLFGVSGIEGRALLDIVPVARSWNEADVYLRAPLDESQYNLTIYVTDGNKTTQVESTILATDDLGGGQVAAEGPPTDSPRQHHPLQQQQLLPFINPRHVFHVPENAQPDEPIGFVAALESEKSDLPVRFELRGKGADKFSIKYVFGPKGQSKADIVLAQPLDYEQQNLFTLKVLALNAWTNAKLDTRNVATMDIVVTVGDVQDTAPVFKNLPQALYLANTMRPGDLVAKLEAEDGDHGDQRPINFALDANSPLAAYFSLHKSTGELRLTKPIGELALHSAWGSGSWSVMSMFASEQPDPSSYDHLWPPMFAKADLPLILVELVNEAPQFVGGWQTGHSPDSRVLHGFLNEQQLVGPASAEEPVRWFTNYTSGGSPEKSLQIFDELIRSMNGRPSVVDLGLGANGTFELTLEGADADLFRLDPVLPVSKQSAFSIMVAPNANRSLFDREAGPTEPRPRSPFQFDLVARDFGSVERKSSRIRCSIELMDTNDNAPQFDAGLYSWSVYENAPVGQLVGSVRARDPDTGDAARVRYTGLSGHDQQMFRLEPENGQITLSGHLDREKKSLYLLIVEARDFSGVGNANYSQIVIQVLDVNDNAPVFLQTHYDAVLLADGTFHQPLVVKAVDSDEAGTANGQVAYEIVAGNQNEQFSIDSVSGVIYPNDGVGAHEQAGPVQVPSILLEPIVPFAATTQPSSNLSPQHRDHPEAAGKILPSHEVEGAPRNNNSSGIRHRIRVQADGSGEIEPRSVAGDHAAGSLAALGQNANRSIFGEPAAVDREQLPGLDLLLHLDSQEQTVAASHQKRAIPQASQLPAMRLPPVTTLVVRAHDFGIPLRSSTVKVNIYNQALLSRSISLILNGTAEQLELRREAIERAFGSIVGSRATIESIDALSESSSISVARLRLAVPQHSLVDLTDLSALMAAIDYHPHQTSEQQRNHVQGPPHYYAISGLFPVNNVSSNSTSQPQLGHHLYSDINSFALDANNQLERRLLIYIIIVGVCILALLVIWMIYSCSRENDHVKIIEKSVINEPTSAGIGGSYKRSGNTIVDKRKHFTATGDKFTSRQDVGTNGYSLGEKTLAKTTLDSAIGNNLAKCQQRISSPIATGAGQLDTHSTGSQLNGSEIVPGATLATTLIRPDHLSMYNGQVWFGPGGQPMSVGCPQKQAHSGSGRRASSAPSAASLDSALHSAIQAGGRNSALGPRQATGQFFPNTIGYMENLASMSTGQMVGLVDGKQLPMGQYYYHQVPRVAGNRRHRRRKVAPMVLNGHSQPYWLPVAPAAAPNKPPRHSPRPVDAAPGGYTNGAFVQDLESGAARGAFEHSSSGPQLAAGSHSRLGSAAGSSSDDESLVLNSDQELLGFDSNGTPIIASHQRRVVATTKRPDLGATGGSQQATAAASASSSKAAVAPPTGEPKMDRDQLGATGEVGVGAPDGAGRGALTGDGGRGRGEEDGSHVGATGTIRRQKSTCEPLELEAEAAKPVDLIGELNARLAAKRQQQQEQEDENKEAAKIVAATGDDGRSPLERASSADSAASGSRSGGGKENPLSGMLNRELLEKQSIFAITYSGLATDTLPA